MACIKFPVGREFSRSKPWAQIISKVIFCIIPFSQIVVGALHLEDCPAQPYIPLYLIVFGGLCLLLVVFIFLPIETDKKNQSTGNENQSNDEEKPDTKKKWKKACGCLNTVWTWVVFAILLGWFMFGNVWIYSIYEPNYEKNYTFIEPHCDKKLYLFAFLTTTLVYALLGSALFSVLCLWIIYKFAAPDNNENDKHKSKDETEGCCIRRKSLCCSC